eukprot:13252445-Alexandrium_andersonii.AAC.1
MNACYCCAYCSLPLPSPVFCAARVLSESAHCNAALLRRVSTPMLRGHFGRRITVVGRPIRVAVNVGCAVLC